MTNLPSHAPSTEESPPELLCHLCGYDLRAHPHDGVCPECRTSIAESLEAAKIPLRPHWRDSDPRWRRRILAGLWILVLLPLMDVLRAFDWASRIPMPTLLPAQGAIYTLEDTLLSWPGVFQSLAFCIGLVLVFSKERGRRRNKLDWTRRWGVLCTYVISLLSAASLFFLFALVLTGISAVFLSMPRKYQPGVTPFFVNMSFTYLRYGPYPRTIAIALAVAFSSIAILLACIALLDALRSITPKRLAIIFLAPLALFALFHLVQAADYCVRLGSAPAMPLAYYWLYFWPEPLSKYLAGHPQPDAEPLKLIVEAVKWATTLAITLWLTTAQALTWRQRRKPVTPPTSKPTTAGITL